jgi:pilus assembly protein CpaC
VELRDGQSFALAGLMDNNETKSISKIPGLGNIPIIGNLFKSTSFQKQETELMFIVTADLVKPINRDDLPVLHGIDGLKKGSPLGVEPKGEGIKGRTGFSTGEVTPGATPAPATETAPKTSAPPAPTSTDQGGKGVQGTTGPTTEKRSSTSAATGLAPAVAKGTP